LQASALALFETPGAHRCYGVVTLTAAWVQTPHPGPLISLDW
jgi:hypothetical protein